MLFINHTILYLAVVSPIWLGVSVAVNVSFIPLHIPVSPVMVILGMAIESNAFTNTVTVSLSSGETTQGKLLIIVNSKTSSF